MKNNIFFNWTKFFIIFIIFFSFINLNFANSKMSIVYYDSFPPYSWKDNDGVMRGILVDISRAVLKKWV